MSVFDGIISILDWVKDKLPIQNRVERWKNEIDKLTKERDELLKGKWDSKKAARYLVIESRIDKLFGMLKNKADSA